MDSSIHKIEKEEEEVTQDVLSMLEVVQEGIKSKWGSFQDKIKEYGEKQNQAYLSPMIRGINAGKHKSTGGTDKSLRKDKLKRRKHNKRARTNRRINRQRLKRAS